MNRDLGWFVTLSCLVSVAVIGWGGSNSGFASTTVLWLIFGAIVAIGLAGLHGQAFGIGRVIDDLEQIKRRLDGLRQRDS